MAVASASGRAEHELTLESASLLESMLEQLFERGVHGRNGREAIANIPGRQHAEFSSEPAGTAAFVHHGDDGGEVINTGGALGLRFGAQAFEHGRKTRPATNGDDARYIRGHRREATGSGGDSRAAFAGRKR